MYISLEVLNGVHEDRLLCLYWMWQPWPIFRQVTVAQFCPLLWQFRPVFPFANEKVNAAPLLSCCVLLPNISCQNRHIVMGFLFKSVGTYCGSNCCVECVPVLKYVLPTITPAAAAAAITTTTTTTARCMLLYSGACGTTVLSVGARIRSGVQRNASFLIIGTSVVSHMGKRSLSQWPTMPECSACWLHVSRDIGVLKPCLSFFQCSCHSGKRN